MSKTAIELAKEMNINFHHLQKVWASFVLNKDLDSYQLFTILNEKLTNAEKSYLIYIGLDKITEVIADGLDNLSEGLKNV